VALAVLGGTVNVASVWVSYASSAPWVTVVPGHETAQQRAYIHSFGGSAVAYNLRHLDGDVRPWPLTHFRGGPDPIGILALATAALGTLAAWALARPGPVAPGRSPPSAAAEPPASTAVSGRSS
jgi:hypothetical protein